MSVARAFRTAVGRFGAGGDEGYDMYEDETSAEPDDWDTGYQERAVRRVPRAHGADFDDIYAQEPAGRYRTSPERPAPLALVQPPHLEFGLVAPRSFDEAQQIADRFRGGAPVIVDLQGCEPELAKRLTDFCSGLAYALEGSLQSISAETLLLAPRDMELSADAGLGLRGTAFLNQM